MGWRDMFSVKRFQPQPGELRTDFLARLGRDGLPFLGQLEILRSPVWELCKEVTALREEVDALRREVGRLRSAQ